MTRDDEFIGQLEGYLDEFEGVTPLPSAIRQELRAELPYIRQIGPRFGLMRTVTMVTPVRFAITAAALVVVAIVGINLLRSSAGPGGPTASASQLGSASVSPEPTSVGSPETNDLSGDYKIGRHLVTVDGIRFSFSVPASRWEPYPSKPTLAEILISKSVQGPQGAEAVIYWATYPDGALADPCAYLAARPPLTNGAGVASVVAMAPGTELVTGPEDVTVGGYAAKHVVVTVREAVGCEPGFFYNWKAQTGGALWTETRVGDTIRVWVVDVNGVLLFIGGETTTDSYASPLSKDQMSGLDREINQIVDSITFE
jgi:hypothetical protein